ncbi:hypothetical protein [Chryseosolibacter indicus]|uniref:Uncharacterized protein n=1 Tax=Chryseosolibacter indicus TaxID=2782351 RepID=A0ABS5VLS6_9BACT|nr:hypothetical protein [Chryseosolibacter indicus]MBT1702418.1 hypothetical protein [Chryseosolibacter indicus]
MSEELSTKKIIHYEDLLNERKRLEILIENQKNIIRHDLEELKNEFKKEIRPAVEAASFVKKIAKPETRNGTLLKAGASLAFDFALKRMFNKSNFVIQWIVPRLLKNYTSHILYKWQETPTHNGRAFPNKSTSGVM